MTNKLNLNMGNVFIASKLDKIKRHIIDNNHFVIKKTIDEIRDAILNDPFTIKTIPENLWLAAFIVGALKNHDKKHFGISDSYYSLANLAAKIYKHYEDESRYDEIINDGVESGKAFWQRCIEVNEESLKTNTKNK